MTQKPELRETRVKKCFLNHRCLKFSFGKTFNYFAVFFSRINNWFNCSSEFLGQKSASLGDRNLKSKVKTIVARTKLFTFSMTLQNGCGCMRPNQKSKVMSGLAQLFFVNIGNWEILHENISQVFHATNKGSEETHAVKKSKKVLQFKNVAKYAFIRQVLKLLLEWWKTLRNWEIFEEQRCLQKHLYNSTPAGAKKVPTGRNMSFCKRNDLHLCTSWLAKFIIKLNKVVEKSLILNCIFEEIRQRFPQIPPTFPTIMKEPELMFLNRQNLGILFGTGCFQNHATHVR